MLIVPSHFRGGLILGAEGGRGVLLAKTTAGTWSPPAVYTLAGGSVGLQLGLESSQVIFIIMNDNALDAILSNNFKFGADMNVAFGPVGGGRGTAFAGGFKPDVYVYSRNRGLFGGGALSGGRSAVGAVVLTVSRAAPDGHPHLHLLPGKIQLHVLNLPGLRKPQHPIEKLLVVHPSAHPIRRHLQEKPRRLQKTR